MLSITKIHSAGASKGGGYSSYLDHLNDTHAFDEYARAHELGGPLPFWFGGGAVELGLSGVCSPKEVGHLSEGHHPAKGAPLVKGAGRSHVMGADLTFSCPKDVSVLFAGADAKLQADIVRAMHGSVKEALGYAQSIAITRHGKGGAIKQLAKSVVASVYTHFASRALDPQLHAHAFLFNVGQRQDGSWSALEHKSQFEHQKATGILFRVALAHRLGTLGFQITASDGLFTVDGISQAQREALSKRSRELQEAIDAGGMGNDAASKKAAALATRSRKDEPPLKDLIAKFSDDAKNLGLTPSVIAGLRGNGKTHDFALDQQALVDRLTISNSVFSKQDVLRAICTQAMGQWSAGQCLEELERLIKSPLLVHLAQTDTLTQVYTSKKMLTLESDISLRVELGKNSKGHQIEATRVDAAFDALQNELTAKVGVKVNLDEQRAAAHHICYQTGTHAFVEGWAGTGKTTLLKAVGDVFRCEGYGLVGTALSASAALNLERETDIRSSTLAGLLLSIENGSMKLGPKTVVVLDEAGLVNSELFGLLQKQVVSAGAKLVAIGDPKQLQPIEAGGIFKSLITKHGAVQVSRIQRQKTDISPLLKYLESQGAKSIPGVVKERAKAIWALPEDARLRAIEALASLDPKVARAIDRWRARFDHQWLRAAVQSFATGQAQEALQTMEEHGCLHLISDKESAQDALISDWSTHKASLADKAIIAATRADVAALNAKARSALVAQGVVLDANGMETFVKLRDETEELRRFAPGDRMVFTKNDRTLGLVNGLLGTVQSIHQKADGPHVVVALDDVNASGQRLISVPVSFGYFDHAYCLTNHKAQGKTVDTAFVFVDPRFADREWSYVAASRSKHGTHLYVDESTLTPLNVEAHHQQEAPVKSPLEALASFMSRSRAKGTTLDYERAPSDIKPTGVMQKASQALDGIIEFAKKLGTQNRQYVPTPTPREGAAPEPELQQ